MVIFPKNVLVKLQERAEGKNEGDGCSRERHISSLHEEEGVKDE
jgi:hypothetical protein